VAKKVVKIKKEQQELLRMAIDGKKGFDAVIGGVLYRFQFLEKENAYDVRSFSKTYKLHDVITSSNTYEYVLDLCDTDMEVTSVMVTE